GLFLGSGANTNQVQVTNTASAVVTLNLTGATTGNNPTISTSANGLTLASSSGALVFTSLPASAQSNALCYNSSTGAVTYNSGVTTCLASFASIKDLKRVIDPDEGLRIVLAAQPWVYENNVEHRG